jgi:multimeric flavodoxin WrbA
MAGRFIEGLQSAGAEVTDIDLTAVRIDDCRDCTCCMTPSVGRCVLPDEMTRRIFPLFMQTDILVLVTPVYFGMVSATLKRFIERLFPALQARQDVFGGTVSQPFRGPLPKTVVIASASWHVSHAFAQMSAYLHYLLGNALTAELYRGNASAFLFWGAFREKRESVLQACRDAGRQMAETGAVDVETARRVSQDLGDLEKTILSHNLSLEIGTKARISSLELASRWLKHREAVPPGSVQNFKNLMLLMFRGAGEGRDFTVKFTFVGDAPGVCVFHVRGKELEITEDLESRADLSVRTTLTQWMQVFGKSEESFLKAMTQGQLLVQGNLSVLPLFSEVFVYGNTAARPG